MGRTPPQGAFNETFRTLIRVLKEKEPISGPEGRQRQQLRKQALLMLVADSGRLATSDPRSFAELPQHLVQVVCSDAEQNAELALRTLGSTPFAARGGRPLAGVTERLA
jgi:hypothetical protein